MAKEPIGRTRIHDVAEAAGVAIKTVSRALNNEPNVREATRERVLAAVKRLNYHPSLSARGLAGRRSYLIGLIYENPSANYIVDVQHGAMARCRDRTPYADMDDEGAAREMTEYLIGLGHRRIGFIAGHPDHFASGRRLIGYKNALKAHRIAFTARYVRQGYFVFESGLEAARQLLTMLKPPTAIFASNDDMAAGMLMAAHEMGIAVPKQLSVAGFDDTYIARTVWPRLTTVHQPSYDLAYSATHLLLQALSTGVAPKPVRLRHRLVCRASTGAVNDSDSHSRAARPRQSIAVSLLNRLQRE